MCATWRSTFVSPPITNVLYHKRSCEGRIRFLLSWWVFCNSPPILLLLLLLLLSAAVLQYLIACNLDMGFVPCLMISVAPHLCFGLERHRHRHRETDREGLQQVYFVVDCDCGLMGRRR
jgi:hypothetical protein